MKIQCSCGAKYTIDVVPGMEPVKFVCPDCGQDYSAVVNEMIRRETGETAPAAAPTPAVPAAPAPPQPPAPSSRLKIASSSPAPTPASPEKPASTICLKHRQPTTEQCYVCKKPICPKCMELFGYFCSPLCKSKGENLNVPVYEGQTFVKEAKYWRKAGSIGAVIVVLLVLAAGAWIWYAWIGSAPRAVFSVRFDDKSYSGSSFISDGQIVFLHGGTLARYDLKTRKAAWTAQVVTDQQIDEEMKRDNQADDEARKQGGPGDVPFVSPLLHRRRVRMQLEGAYSLYGSGKNIWLANSGAGTLTRYDWDTGNAAKQITLTNGLGEFAVRGNELMMLERLADGGQAATHIDLAGGDVRTETIRGFSGTLVAENSVGAGGSATGGLPLSPYSRSKPLDPRKVAADAQNLTPGARTALPALMANAAHQQQIMNEINDEPGQPHPAPAAAPAPVTGEQFMLVPDGDGYVGFSMQMTEQHLVEHDAMRAAPARSALDNPNLNGTRTTDTANEILNDMQRNSGGDKVTEDQSRYRVSIRRPASAAADWTGEVVGAPRLFPQKTVNVLAAGKSVLVFDKSGKKLWQADLTYPVSYEGGEEGSLSYGLGPCVERGDTLYVIDQAVLTAFDLSTGNARWRLGSVGVVGLFFDDRGMLYINTTTGNPNDLKYSRQIDVTKKTQAVLVKVDPATGRTVWTSRPRGFVVYLSGKFIYTFYAFDPGDEEDQANDGTAGLVNPAFLCITRIDPKSGRALWEHTENRAPIDTRFDGNTIRLLFRKEVEVLRYWTL